MTNITEFMKENLETFAQYDEESGKWEIFPDDLHELLEMFMNKINEEWGKRKCV